MQYERSIRPEVISLKKTNKTNKMLASKVKKEERKKAQINTINDDKGKKEHKYR